ncbi:glycosyltransferase family 2 protein [Nubsella zeaxanthinifaciens]|uniref:glycosyltransferase family 2 protein n=1 Tax=Nubsella zeaxanthinifaciens TaxID=392412 RepID=UPI003CFC0620
MVVKISIITVTFNAENTLLDTILSVTSQKDVNFEYLIIDGGSQDKTVDIITQFNEAIDFWVTEKDKGIYDAMNKGIQAAKGDYILFLNAGDRFHTNSVLSEVSHYLDYHGDVIYGHTYVNKEGIGRIVKSYSLKDDWKTIPYCHQSVFIKREVLLKNLFDLNFRIAADYNQYQSLKKQNYIFKPIDNIISIYDDAGYSSMNVKTMLAEYKKISLNNTTNFIKRLKVWLYFFLRTNLSKY